MGDLSAKWFVRWVTWSGLISRPNCWVVLFSCAAQFPLTWPLSTQGFKQNRLIFREIHRNAVGTGLPSGRGGGGWQQYAKSVFMWQKFKRGLSACKLPVPMFGYLCSSSQKCRLLNHKRNTKTKAKKRGLFDKASDFGSGDWGLKFLRGRCV